MAKMRSGRARRLIRRQGGVTARRASARIHLHRRFPSWSLHNIHVPKAALHDTTGFCIASAKSRADGPFRKNGDAPTSGFVDTVFRLLGKTRSGCKNPAVSCIRVVHFAELRRIRCRMTRENAGGPRHQPRPGHTFCPTSSPSRACGALCRNCLETKRTVSKKLFARRTL